MNKLLTIIVTILSLTQFSNGSVTRTLYKYDFSAIATENFNDTSDLSKGFVFEFSLKERPTKHTTLIDSPNSFKLSVENALSTYYSTVDNNLALVSQIRLEQLDKQFAKTRNKREKMRIELPINAIKGDIKKARIALVYDGARFYFTLNGKEFDKNFPVGNLKKPTNVNSLNKHAFNGLKFSTDTSKIIRQKISEKSDTAIQYYTPAGFNTWAGDVSLFYHNDVFYLLYLFDRNHHGSRWGGGAHEFNLLTSKDLINWEDHGPVIEVDESWKSVGTGTMFFHKGKYYISFGWHTSRVIDYKHTVSSKYAKDFAMQSYPIARKDFAPLYPSGANIAVSNDGINFKWTEKFYNISENPSIYQTSKGLKMFSGYAHEFGVWTINDIEGVWKKENITYRFSGKEASMRNTTECPCYFENNNWRYLIMGSNGFWGAKGDDEWTDMASKGFDIYDGLCVPMVTNYKDNRLILGGWFRHDWGSAIVLRELFAYPDGVLGIKWLKELEPPEKVVVKTTEQNDGFAELSLDQDKSYSAKMTIYPKNTGKFRLRFQQTNASVNDATLTIDFAKATAQIQDEQKTHIELLPMSKIVKTYPERSGWTFINYPNDVHFFSKNFCIENLRNIDKPFELRFILRRSKKLGSNIIDIEIAHSRTMISNRVNARFNRIEIEYPNGDVKNITLFEYPDEEKF